MDKGAIMNHICLGCSLCEQPVSPVTVGDQFIGHTGIRWVTVGLDSSGQGVILRGSSGQIRTEPLDPNGQLQTRHLTRV